MAQLRQRRDLGALIVGVVGVLMLLLRPLLGHSISLQTVDRKEHVKSRRVFCEEVLSYHQTQEMV